MGGGGGGGSGDDRRERERERGRLIMSIQPSMLTRVNLWPCLDRMKNGWQAPRHFLLILESLV